MFEARKRTALDGRVWWCVFDTVMNKWSTLTCFGRYRTKFDCGFAISCFANRVI